MTNVETVPVDDPAQKEQLAMFKLALVLHAHDPKSELAVVPAVCKATGKTENLVVVIKQTPAGIKVLPVAVIPIGVDLIRDFDMSQGHEQGPSIRAGKWSDDDAGERLN